MDTPQAPDTSALDTNSAAAAFSALLEPPKAEEKPEGQSETPEVEAKAEPEVEAEPVEAEGDQPEADGDKITIEVDGKVVELTKAELADYYKNGLRQSDYTKKTMEVAEQRKAADAELAKAREERTHYANGLNRANAVLAAQLQERTAEQWDQLAKTDPASWVVERNLYEQRHAAYQQNMAQLQQLDQMSKAEADQHRANFLSQQREELIAKLPDWKDPTKAKADQSALRSWLAEKAGFTDKEIESIADHRAVLIGLKAMKYDELVSKAQAAQKRVQAAPQKVMKPGVGDRPSLDGRTAAMKQLGKSGSIDDAARVFASIL